MSIQITKVTAKEILALRGNVCLEVRVETDNGGVGISTPEVGVSTGTYEAHMILDGDNRYGGMGVRQAAENVVNMLAQAVVGMDVLKQRDIDRLMCELDGTPNKSRIGANAIVGVSLAVAKAAANSSGLPLYQYLGGPNACYIPMPIIGIGTGGRYRDPGKTRWFKPSYEFMPHGAGSFARAMEINYEVRSAFLKIMQERYGNLIAGYGKVNDLGPLLKSDFELLEAMTEAIVRAGYEGDVGLYFDAASDCYYEEDIDRYVGIFEPGEKDKKQMLDTYQSMVSNFPIVSLEDVLREDDIEGNAWFTKELGIEIVGDDFFTTNIERLRNGIAAGACNSMVLKITQVGTVSEAFEACQLAHRNGYNVHPCGSRGDKDSVGDFAVALNAGQIRAVDYNRLLTVEQELGDAAIWPGKSFLKGWRNQL